MKAASALSMNLSDDFAFEVWEQKHWSAAPANCPSSAADDFFPVNPGVDLDDDESGLPGGGYSAWAVKHFKHTLVDTIPTPNLVYPVSDNVQISVWYLDAPILPGVPKYNTQRNLWFMVCSVLVRGLQGIEVFSLKDPGLLGLEFERRAVMMSDFRAALKAAGLWDGNHMHTKLATRGGKQKTAEQTRARSENVRKAREAKRAEADARARQVVDLVDGGTDTEAVAVTLAIAPSSVPRTLSRARARLEAQTPATAPSSAVQHVTAKTPRHEAFDADEAARFLDGL